MLEKIFIGKKCIPTDAFLILASTVGEIDVLENAVLRNKHVIKSAYLSGFLKKVQRLAKIKKPGMFISCACASSLAAIVQASEMILRKEKDCVLVVAADSVTEFVFSGFSSLMALDKDKPKPFDKNRSGLSLGDGAGFVLLMSDERAIKENRKILGEVVGGSVTSDANHMTGPARDGNGLVSALKKAFNRSRLSPSEVGCISSHGTGTLYNDAMEIKAFRKFYKNALPVYSIKGAIGHTLGAAGLIEVALALKVQLEKVVPATVGLRHPDLEAEGWVSLFPQRLRKDTIVLNNCGFGGINAVLILKRYG